MRNQIQIRKTYNKGIVFILIAISFIFSINTIYGQEIIVNKSAVESTTTCNQFDVTLEIIGNPPPRPQDVILIIDRSGSMGFGSSPYPIDHAKTAATSFVNNFFDSDLTGQNRIAIVSFSSSASEDIGFTGNANRQDVLDEIDDLNANGGTNMEDAIETADDLMIDHGRFNCSTSRSIILLSDGVPQRSNANNNTCSTTSTPTVCQTRAIQAANDAYTHTHTDNVVYNQSIFTIGLTGGIDGTEQNIAEATLNSIQNSGAFLTEAAADLTSIYNVILGQLTAAATALPGMALVSDIIQNGFSYVPGTLVTANNNNTAQGGTASNSGQLNSWHLSSVFSGSYTLKYSMLADPSNVCGNQNGGSSIMNYENSSCAVDSEIFQNPTVCVPCPTIDIDINRVGCTNAITYEADIDQGGCSSTGDSYAWNFYLNNNLVGTSNTLFGTFNYTGIPDFTGTFLAELSYTEPMVPMESLALFLI